MSDPYTTGHYRDCNPRWHAEDAPAKAQALSLLLTDRDLRPRTVIDVGCGTGAVLRELARLQAGRLPDTRWEGWDPAADALDREDLPASVTLRAGDALRDAHPHDLVLCIDTFEHVPDDVGFLRMLSALGQDFVFRIPLDLSAWDVARPVRLDRVRGRYRHLHVYTRTLALQVLAEAGFEVLAERYHRLPTEGSGATMRPLPWIRRLGERLSPHRTARLLGGFSLLVHARPVATRKGSDAQE